MHHQRLMNIAVRQRTHLVRDLLVAAAGAVIMAFYISAFTSVVKSPELARKNAPQMIEPAPRIALAAQPAA